MPIKREHRHRYPANWKEIRERVLVRARNRCELCGAPNNHWIRRKKQTPAVFQDFGFADRGVTIGATFYWRAVILVVLTVAHLDPTYECGDDSCLLALCQRCHLKIDAHFRHAARMKRKAA